MIVCRPGRGTINHAALTLEAARRRNLTVRGLIVNGADEPPGLEELANRAELARLAPILEIIPDETINSLSGVARLRSRYGPGTRRVAGRIAEIEPQSRGDAGRQPEAEAVEPRGARPARHHDARSRQHAHGARIGQPHRQEDLAPAHAEAHESRDGRVAVELEGFAQDLLADGGACVQREGVGAVGQRREPARPGA